MKFYISWLDFFKLLLALVLLFLVLKAISKLLLQFFRRNLYKHRFKKASDIVNTLFVPLALFMLIAAFVLIDYHIHGVLVLIAGIVLFKHIKNYCSGILVKINPLVDVGVNLTTGEYKGEIEKLLPFGLILKVEYGERFISYSTIDEQGFCVNQKTDGTMRKTIYLSETENINEVLDVLFDNPLIDFTQKPSIWNLPEEQNQQLQLTLEKGAKIESIMDYLNQYNIKSSLTKH